MPQVIEQPDIFGRIGKSIGEGVGEQLGRSRLASNLEKMQEKGAVTDPLKQAAGLLRSGATPDQISQFLPLIQQEQQRREFTGGAQIHGISPSPISVSGISPQVTPTSFGKAFEPLQGTTEALNARASQLIASQPSLYRDPLKALDKAQKEYDTQQSILSKTASEFESAIKKRAEKYGVSIDTDIPGTMQQDFVREAQALAATGKMSPEKAADKLSADLLDFSKARANLRNSTIPSLFGLSISGKEGQKNLNAIRKEYADNNQLELFENDLVNKIGLSTGVASYLAFPVSDNKDIGKYADDTKKKFSIADYLNPFQGKISSLVSGIKEKKVKGGKSRNEAEIGDYIAKHIKDSDSLNSIATAFNAKGYDPQVILNEVQKQWDAGKVSLNKRQQQDLQKRTNFRATLRDIAYFAGTGLNEQEIVR